MSPTTTKAIRAMVLAVFGAGAAGGVYVGWKQYLRTDPYAEVPKAKHKADPDRAITASGVKFQQFQNGKRVVSGHADNLTVNQDRSVVVMNGIKNGVMQTPKGPLGFSMATGVVNPNLRTVDASGNVRVTNKASGLDVTAPVAQIDGRTGDLRMPRTLQGTIGGGKISADRLTMNPGKDTLSLRNVNYQIKTPKDADVPAAQQNKTWHIDAKDVEHQGLNEVALVARAADGEVIVTAPKIARNARTDVITATGRATYHSAQSDIVADQVVIHRKEGFAVCTGNVVMLTRPKSEWDKPVPVPKDEYDGAKTLEPPLPPDIQGGPSKDPLSEADRKADDALRSGKTLNDYPMSLKAEEITYWYRKGSRHAIAKGGKPTAFQRFDAARWRQVWAPEAHYDGEKNMLDLVGDKANYLVHMKNSIGDTLDTVWLTVSTKEDQKEDEEYMKYGRSKSQYVDRGDDPDDPRGGSTPPQKADPAKGPPPDKRPANGTPPPGKSALKGTP